MTTPWTTLRRLAADTRGSEIAEAAAVLPLMFMVLLGIFWFGQAYTIYGAITRAAQEGARAGAASICATCGTDTLPQHFANATNATQTALLASKLDPTKARVPSAPPAFTVCAGGLVSCNVTNNYCVQAPVHMTKAAGNTGACGISVSLQYPFQFWLPFTSLNKQQIWISSAALERLESQ